MGKERKGKKDERLQAYFDRHELGLAMGMRSTASSGSIDFC
jgi:hypothetical protein